MKNQILVFTLFGLAVNTSTGQAQFFNGPNNATSPIGRSGNVGLGTNWTTPSPAPGAQLHVKWGDVIFESLNGGKVQFTNPSGEDGMSIFSNAGGAWGSFGKRADIRYDGSTLKIGCNAAASPPGTANLLNITNGGLFGIGVVPTTAKFEINSGTSGNSGLKFTQLTSGSSTGSSNGKVLTVDASGNVTLVPDIGSGSYTGGTGITISSNVINSTWTQTGSNIFNNNVNNVGIGVPTPTAKLDVMSSNDISFESINTKVMNTWGVQLGVFGQADNNVGLGFGGAFYGGNTGAFGQAEENLDNLLPEQKNSLIYDLKGLWGSAYNYGITNPRTAIGVYGEGYNDSPNGVCFGLYGYSYHSSNPANDWALYADGNTYCPGGIWTASDERLKENINGLNNALDIIKQITPKSYTFKKDGHFANTKLPDGKQYGFIAQNLEKVLPELVKDAPLFFNRQDKDKENDRVETYKSVQYTALIPILTAAIQEQQNQIAELQEALKTQSGKTTGIINSENSMQGATVYLYQNAPNPFSGSTQIKYELPANAMNSMIGIYDMSGKEIKLVQLNGNQAGAITINGGDLQPGMYIYTLMVDGKAIDSKKMILTSK